MYKNGELTSTMRYIWDGDVLLGGRMEFTDADEPITIRYLYDDSGELYGMDYNGTGYFGFVKNLQGDIISIVPLDFNGDVQLNMEYDAWGKPIYAQASSAAEGLLMAMLMAVTNVGYRGYFYDFDTGLYYLRSRYYDPETGRFINADDTAYLGYDSSPLSMNLFAYCENNPVNYADICGYSGKYILKDEISLIEVERSAGDYVYKGDKQTWQLKTWKELAYVGASSLSHIYPNGVKFYKHCLKGEGQVLAYNYNEAFNQDQQIRQTMISHFFELKNYVTKKYGTKTNYNVCRDGYFNVECSSKDWQLALNSHQATISAHIVYNSSTKMYEADVYVLAIDLYNFNKYRPFVLANNKLVKKSVAFAIQKTGQFIETGLAHDFYSYGIAIFKVKWKAGGDTLSYSNYFRRR